MAFYYVDFGAISSGVGTSGDPFDSTQFTNYNYNGEKISGDISATEGDSFKLKGTNVTLYGTQYISKIGGYNYISWDDSAPYKLSANGYSFINFGIRGPTSWSATMPNIKIENAIIKDLSLGVYVSASPWSGTYTIDNTIIYDNFFSWANKDWYIYINGSTFVNALVLLSIFYDDPTQHGNNQINFNDTIFINCNIIDDGENYGVYIFDYCLFTNSIQEITAGIRNTVTAGNVEFNHCQFNWVPLTGFVSYDNAIIDINSNSLKSSTYGIPNTSTVRYEVWETSGYSKGFWNTDRTGPGAFDFSAIPPTPLPTSAIIDEIIENAVQLCGYDRIRFDKNKFINLRNFLPQMLKSTETEEFLIFFEDFLNTMYEGIPEYIISSTDLPIERDIISPISAYNFKSYIFSANQTSTIQEYTSANNIQQIEYVENTGTVNILIPMLTANNEILDQKISILQKIHQLTELHDPDLIDIEYIQFFAKNLGYNININRNQIGANIGNLSVLYNNNVNTCSAVDENKYLRFVVSNLPTWYKIKSTRNSIKVMLYSFGLIGDLVEYYTNDYNNNWQIDYSGNVSNVNSYYYPSPHFAIIIDIDASYDSISFDWAKRQKIINAIEDLRPVNTVFQKLLGLANRTLQIGIAAQTRLRYHALIK
jgi:hypothetical protein